MTRFTPNELQRELFAEVMNARSQGYIESLSDHALGHAAAAWLRGRYDILTALANIGKEAVREGERSGGYRNAVLIRMMSCMAPLPHETLRWLNDWKCLRDLASPQAMRDADFLEKLEKLATLDEGL